MKSHHDLSAGEGLAGFEVIRMAMGGDNQADIFEAVLVFFHLVDEVFDQMLMARIDYHRHFSTNYKTIAVVLHRTFPDVGIKVSVQFHKFLLNSDGRFEIAAWMNLTTRIQLKNLDRLQIS